VLYPTAKEYAQIIYALSMKFFSLIINELRKTLINIEKIFDLPIAYEREMNLLYIIKQRQMVGSSLTYCANIPITIGVAFDCKWGR
jgi:hypothetical protein